MSRLIVCALCLVPQLAHADMEEEPAATSATAATDSGEPDEDENALPDQSIGASVGIAGGGGGVTPGGFRVAGHYLYQLAEQDWFDGTAAFTFGAGGAACFRDRMDDVLCDHAFADGRGVEVIAAVRRYFAPEAQFRPYARAGVGIGVVRYGDDDLTGITIPLHLGGGVRAKVAPQVAIVAAGELVLGLGLFGRGMGAEPQVGIAITAGAEFRLP